MTKVPSTLRIWLLTDNKPGHRNQIAGLNNALETLCNVESVWVDCNALSLSWWDVWRGRRQLFEPLLAKHGVPDIAIAAGHRTHRALLAVGRATGAKTCVLMKPSLPLCWFDAAIVPAHDLPVSNREDVLITQGVLNAVTPASQPTPGRGVIVLGGVSSHYQFDEALVLEQINAVLAQFPAHSWQLSNSRRTPEGLIEKISPRPNLVVTPWQDTASGWLAQQMRESDMIWVTPDSVSMVYEALTAAVPVGVLTLPLAKKAGRVALGVDRLIKRGDLNTLAVVQDGTPMRPITPPLYEAERAAKWLCAHIGNISNYKEQQ